MPKKLTAEEKKEGFDKFQNSSEMMHINKFSEERNKINGKKPIELSTLDISDDLQPYLDSLFAMVTELKIRGKAKGKL